MECSHTAWQFQSTPSARRATAAYKAADAAEKISIHALREESDSLSVAVRGLNIISIHALREESDMVLSLT